jgi:hypothetical protein
MGAAWTSAKLLRRVTEAVRAAEGGGGFGRAAWEALGCIRGYDHRRACLRDMITHRPSLAKGAGRAHEQFGCDLASAEV